MHRITVKFDKLLQRYQQAEDRRVRIKLKEIALCMEECSLEERQFLGDVIDKFCDLIDLLEDGRETAPCGTCGVGDLLSFRSAFSSRPADSSEELLNRFSGYLLDFGGTRPSTATDYVNRVKTFVRLYLQEIPRVQPLLREAREREGDFDPILFTYQHLEFILANFETKEDVFGNRCINRQKSNLKSALKKFNEFKQTREQ